MVRLEGSDKLKNPPNPVLEPAIFQLVAQCLNQRRYRVPSYCSYMVYNLTHKSSLIRSLYLVKITKSENFSF
jgi:hypothetical protein